MYKFLLSSRYLRTRLIALASIISVTLGVATMIVVNSVMEGFATQMRERIHGILADVIVESISMDGEENPAQTMGRIQELVGDEIAAMTPTVEVYGLMTFEYAGEKFNRPVTIVGILPEGKDAISPMKAFMRSRQENPKRLAEPLDWELTPEAKEVRRRWLEIRRVNASAKIKPSESDPGALENPFEASSPDAASDPFEGDASQLFGESASEAPPADPDAPLEGRVYVGSGLVSFPFVNKETGETETWTMVQPGEDIRLGTVKVGTPEVVAIWATVVDIFQSGMSEYDSNLVFCNLETLQAMRGMLVRQPGKPLDWRDGSVTTIQIKLKEGADVDAVVNTLRAGLQDRRFQVQTWEHKQGPLLEAVEVESAILNVLLFLIIAVAGFGILAIFYMIVVEKTRDIGILKALGASSQGIMSIFLSYGLSLGMVGAGVGVCLGLLFVHYINQIEDFVSWLTGKKVFDESIYYFKEIPTTVEPLMVLWVAGGAMMIAVLASVLPARRAAQLHPVQALRYE